MSLQLRLCHREENAELITRKLEISGIAGTDGVKGLGDEIKLIWTNATKREQRRWRCGCQAGGEKDDPWGRFMDVVKEDMETVGVTVEEGGWREKEEEDDPRWWPGNRKGY